MDSTSNEDRAERRYAEAEDAFLAAIRADRDRIALSVLADKVAAEAKAWNAAAYLEYHVSQDAPDGVLSTTSRSAPNSWRIYGPTSPGRSTVRLPTATGEQPLSCEERATHPVYV